MLDRGWRRFRIRESVHVRPARRRLPSEQGRPALARRQPAANTARTRGWSTRPEAQQGLPGLPGHQIRFLRGEARSGRGARPGLREQDQLATVDLGSERPRADEASEAVRSKKARLLAKLARVSAA